MTMILARRVFLVYQVNLFLLANLALVHHTYVVVELLMPILIQRHPVYFAPLGNTYHLDQPDLAQISHANLEPTTMTKIRHRPVFLVLRAHFSRVLGRRHAFRAQFAR